MRRTLTASTGRAKLEAGTGGSLVAHRPEGLGVVGAAAEGVPRRAQRADALKGALRIDRQGSQMVWDGLLC